jgi:hypothetical protein
MSQHSPKQWFNLEEKFFSDVDNHLLENLRQRMTTAQTAEEITRVLGVNDLHLAEEIAKMNVTVETLAAFRLVPLVAVAWANDRVEENERYTIMLAAEKSGLSAEDPATELLRSWTHRRPPTELLDAWCEYAKTLAASLNEEHRLALKKEVMQQAHSVAEASGGVLGFGSVSSSEKAVLDRVEQALS